MSRERNLKRLRKSLHETQDTLDTLIAETSAELGKHLEGARSDVSKHMHKAGKEMDKSYGKARTRLDSTLKDSSKEVGKLYASTRKDAEKTYGKTRSEVKSRYASSRKDAEKTYEEVRAELIKRYGEASKEAAKRLAELRVKAAEQSEGLRLKAAGLLQGLAAGVVAAKNKLEPDKRLAIRNEKDKYNLGKGGYFKRFMAIAVVIVAKKDLILSLGQQLYSRLQDAEARQSLKDDAYEQYDTMRRLMKAYANGHYREFPYASIVKIVAAVVYFVSVVDLVPDFIPILGLTDDLAVLAWVYSSVKDDLQNFLDWEAANERRREKMDEQKNDSRSTSPVADRGAASPAPARTATASSATVSTTAPATGSTTGGTGAEKAGTTGSAMSSGDTRSTTNSNRVPPTGGSINSSSGSGAAGGGLPAEARVVQEVPEATLEITKEIIPTVINNPATGLPGTGLPATGLPATGITGLAYK